MKRGSTHLIAILIILVLICPLLISMSFAKTVTPTPTKPEPAFPPPNIGTSINSVTGTVYDASGNAIPNAKVTLYNVVWVDNDYKAREPASTKNNNPQLTGDGDGSAVGLYVYTGVLSGTYILTAEKGGISVTKVIWVTGGTSTNDIFIQGYVENGTSPTPGTVVTEGPTYRPPPPDPTSNRPSQDIGTILWEIFRIALMAIIGVQLIVSIAILALGVGKR